MKNLIMALGFFGILTTVSAAQATIVPSQKVVVDAARITERLVLVQDRNKALHVQLVQEFLHGATDVSNTSRIILSISQLGEMSGTTASFVVAESMSLKSARRISGGIYEFTFMDAWSEGGNSFIVTKTIDARKAVTDVLNSDCEEFGSCEIKTSVSVN